MRTLTLLSCLLITGLTSPAQNLHLGVFGGIANYNGDLVDKPFALSKPAFGITGTYELSERFALRASLTHGKVAGADSISEKQYLRQRNFSFENKITELSLLAEITPLSLYRQRLSPYVFFGLALFRNNPYTYDSTGLQVFLQPLGTEGQGLPGSGTQLYSRTQLALPFGGGLRFAFNDNVRLGLEVGLRKLFTDYLDDISTNYADAGELLAVRGPRAVSVAYRGDEVPGGNPVYPEKGAQRGNAEYKDWYYFTGLHLSFRLNGKGGSPFGGGRQRLDCPRVPY